MNKKRKHYEGEILLPNTILRQCYTHFNLNERRLLMLALSNLIESSYHPEMLASNVTYEDWKYYFKEVKNYKETLDNASRGIMKKPIVLSSKNSGDWEEINWLEGVQCIARKGVTVNFSMSVSKLLNSIDKNSVGFTSFKFSAIKDFKYEYSYRLYELLYGFLKQGKVSFSFQSLLKDMDLKDTYKEWRYFNNRILKKIMEDLESSDLKVSYQSEGRPVTKIHFTIKKKRIKKKLIRRVAVLVEDNETDVPPIDKQPELSSIDQQLTDRSWANDFFEDETQLL